MARMTRARRTVAVLVAGLVAGVPLAVGAGAGAPSAAAADGPVMTKHRIGTTVQGRGIYAFHRSYPGATKRLVVIGSIHGDEPAGTRVTALLKKSSPPRNVDLWIIRSVNPDGLVAHRRTNAHRVDLNRNFPYRWRRINAGTSTYSGPSAASEPETKALIAFIKKVNPRITITFHQPLFGVGLNSKRKGVVYALANRIGLPVESYTCTSACYGSFTSWHNHTRDGVAVTVEFGHPRVSDWRIRRAASAVLSVGSDY